MRSNTLYFVYLELLALSLAREPNWSLIDFINLIQAMVKTILSYHIFDIVKTYFEFKVTSGLFLT